MKSKSQKSKKTIEYLLEEIKRLLILQLYKSGVSTEEIGVILRCSYKTIEIILPKKAKKRKS